MKTSTSMWPPAANYNKGNLAAYLSNSALRSLQGVISPRAWFVARNWSELDRHLAKGTVQLALVEPAADVRTDLTALTAIMRRHAQIPVVAYVAVTPENLLVVAHLSRYGLADVFMQGLGDDYQRFAQMVERVCAKSLAFQFLGSLESQLAKLGPRLVCTVQEMFEQPDLFERAADIARHSGISTKQLHRKFQAAQIGTPKKLLVAAKLVQAYTLLRNCMEPICEISSKVGYTEARGLSTLCVEVFGCPASKLRHEARTSEVLLSILDWLYKPPTRALGLCEDHSMLPLSSANANPAKPYVRPRLRQRRDFDA
jgi:AraC-like DNA-binding protein